MSTDYARSSEALHLHGGGFSCYGSQMMCDMCSDVIVFHDWFQLAVEGDHEVWFTASECLCGFRIVQMERVEQVKV